MATSRDRERERGRRAARETADDEPSPEAAGGGDNELRPRRLELLAAATHDALWTFEPASGGVFHAGRWHELLGLSEADLAAEDGGWLRRIYPGDRPELEWQLGEVRAGERERVEAECRIRHSDGSLRWVRITAVASRGESGEVARLAAALSDVTRRREAEERIIHDGLHDPLTGLPNRAQLQGRLGDWLDDSNGSAGAGFAVICLDLDRFQMLNEGLGHRYGDQVLVATARRLERCVRPGDTVARLAGDSFVLLLEEIESEAAAAAVARRILEVLGQPHRFDQHEIFITASLGVVVGGAGYARASHMVRDAEIAMYRAKATGKARYVFFESGMHERAVELHSLERDLRLAMDRDELRLHFQPIVTMAEGRIIGFEALVRWQHPTRGLLMPAEFIPLAEETGLIVRLGRWVLHEACRQTHVWQEEFPADPPLVVTVNLSGRELARTELVEEVRSTLDMTCLEGSCLKLEMTESVLMDNTEKASALFSQLREQEIQILMDDFGTGYSSLSYLHRFPTETLKIDRSFVQELLAAEGKPAIIDAIVTLAKNLGMEVVAEGVETVEQFALLRELGCHYGQGFFFSKPLAGPAATSLLAADPRWR